jgi:hypothetical protein
VKEYEIKEKDGGIYKGTKDEAIEEFKKEIFIKYNGIDPSSEVEYIVKEIVIGSILQLAPLPPVLRLVSHTQGGLHQCSFTRR